MGVSVGCGVSVGWGVGVGSGVWVGSAVSVGCGFPDAATGSDSTVTSLAALRSATSADDSSLEKKDDSNPQNPQANIKKIAAMIRVFVRLGFVFSSSLDID